MPSTMTISEAFAELKQIPARIAKKQEFILRHFSRRSKVADPLERESTTQPKAIASEMDSIKSLWRRTTQIRMAVLAANMATQLTVSGRAMSVQEWLEWRREVQKSEAQLVQSLNSKVNEARDVARRESTSLRKSDEAGGGYDDIILNMNETEVLAWNERLDKIAGELDGQLSRLNATTSITIPD